MLDRAATLDGSVQSQGIRIGHRSWLDSGSKDWQNTEPALKAAAYQAALITGWTNKGLIAFMQQEYRPRVDEEWAKLTIETLQEFLREFPVEVEQVCEAKDDNPILKKRGDENTYVLR